MITTSSSIILMLPDGRKKHLGGSDEVDAVMDMHLNSGLILSGQGDDLRNRDFFTSGLYQNDGWVFQMSGKGPELDRIAWPSTSGKYAYLDEEYNKLRNAYHAAYTRRDPCDVCGKSHPQYHHATVWGENLCHDCYEAKGKPCTQIYPGDRGGAPFLCGPAISGG